MNALVALSQIRHGWPWASTCFLVGFVLIVGAFIAYARHRTGRTRVLNLANTDRMTGAEFERYVARLLQHQGYQTKLTPPSGDFGVDIIATRGQDRIAIQCKRHRRDISRTAVSDAVAGLAHYRCNRAMVVTNAEFTDGAQQLGRSTDCILIGRSELARWIQDFQRGAPAESKKAA